MELDEFCPDCGKNFAKVEKVCQCTMCEKVFCENHSKSGLKKEIMCRDCFKILIRKKMIKDYGPIAIKLDKELRVLNCSKASSRLQLEKKRDAHKRLKSQLESLKSQHLEKIQALKVNVSNILSSNFSQQNAALCLEKALKDIQECVKLKKSEFILILSTLDKLVQEKTALNYEVYNLDKLIEYLRMSEKDNIPFIRLKKFCCLNCYKKLKDNFRKHYASNLFRNSAIAESIKNDRHNAKSLGKYNTDACNCSIH
ncbi:hypothetical protein SteCoe_37927 [Stentor coeruleus]|uniref:Uncharacterized protein n=1 Tax=Stentor coeruleus TaxID=5963 RepID=A0A1R2AM42_9CILI|nr:hypothetical protein SteCoe_37927 [Stentor coeruleus]